jgi:putative DNA primase/helicase
MPPEPRPGPGPPRGPEGTAAQMKEFLRALSCPDGCMELRVWGATWDSQRRVVPGDQYARTLSGWYDISSADGLEDLIVDALRISGVSVYVTLNPVHPDLISRCRNKLGKNRNTTAATDILRYERFLIDIDPIRRAGISATDAEVAAALRVRDQILAEIPGLRSAAIWGCSGNGGYIAPRVLLPNDAEGRALVLSLVERISKIYSTPQVRVEVKPEITAANMLVTLAGTKKCKGSDTPERPHRAATLDGAGQEPRWDTLSWAAAPGQPGRSEAVHVPPGAPGGRVRRAGRPTLPDPAWVEHRAAITIAGMQPAVAGQGGHGQTFAVAVALIHGFRLSPDRAWPILTAYNARCEPPWSEAELRHKLDDAAKHTPREAPGWLLDADRPGYQAKNGEPPPLRPPAPEGPAAQERNLPPVAEAPVDDPHHLARTFLDGNYREHEDLFLRYWQDEYHWWDGSRYRIIPPKELRAEVTGHVAATFRLAYDRALERWRLRQQAAQVVAGEGRQPQSVGKGPELIPVTTRIVGDVLQALAGMCLLTERAVPQVPAWICHERPWPLSEIMPARNAIVHIPTLAGADPESAIAPPSPCLFAAYAVDYDVDPRPPEPTNWLTFLGSLPPVEDGAVQLQLWPGDHDQIAVLQEFMGLCLVPDNSFNKMLCLIGPQRSGKGTIAWVIEQLVGTENVAAPRLGEFDDKWVLWDLIGKPVTFLSEARIGPKSDQAAIVDILLKVTGNDPVRADRKNLRPWTGRLMTRFILQSNEMPRLAEVSGALADRMIFLQMTESFLGHEDLELQAKLRPELPSILRWAAKGLVRLKRRGRFDPPQTSRRMNDDMREIGSPVQAFLDDWCDVGPLREVGVQDLYVHWTAWCKLNGRRDPGEVSILARNLRAILPRMETRQRRVEGGRRERYFVGLKPLPPHPAQTPTFGLPDSPPF